MGVGNPPRRRPQGSQDIYHTTTTTQRGPGGPTRTRRKSPGEGPHDSVNPSGDMSLCTWGIHFEEDHQGIIQPLGDDSLG
ncbi:hypothetical protein JTB14_008762 [Gonioctena quinquepunctata]|nr:hypothetical protein JTB14_008762 [Gonioctena quinquepunctata]